MQTSKHHGTWSVLGLNLPLLLPVSPSQNPIPVKAGQGNFISQEDFQIKFLNGIIFSIR